MASDKNPEILISEEKLQARIDSLAVELSQKVPSNCIIVALLKGGYMFAADLHRALGRLGMQPEIEFMRLSSYGNEKTSSGRVIFYGQPPQVYKKDVLLIDDILDTGRSLQFSYAYLEDIGANSIISCVLLDKPSRREIDVTADYVGFTIEDRFVIGYGLDYAENHRYLPHIAAID